MTRTVTTQPPFTLDTSGDIDFGPHPGIVLEGALTYRRYVAWPDLDPFTQGYIEALIASVRGYHEPHYLKWDERTNARTARYVAFRDLAPEALALILRDCAWLCTDASDRRESAECGRALWAERQAGGLNHLGPLTAYIRADGKVDFKDAAQ